MHKLLSRIIRKNNKGNLDLSPYQKLFDAISSAFNQFDEDRNMLERSLTLTSKELNAINQQLSCQLDEVNNYKQAIEVSYIKQEALLNSSREAIFSFSKNGKLEKVNRSGLLFFNLKKDEIENKTEKQIVKLLLKRITKKVRFEKSINKLESNKLNSIQGYFETNDHKHYEYYSIPEILNGEYIGRAWCLRNVTELREKQIQLSHQANHDALTDLPNRPFILESLKHEIINANRCNTQVSVLFIDLDDFKKINDSIGHEEGDLFLIGISKRIRSTLRKEDVLGRLGGDEFIIILKNFSDKGEIKDIYQRILSIFEKPFPIKGNEYIISCSIGMSTFPKDGKNPEELIRKADMAMYQAKKNGKKNIHFYNEELEKDIIERISLESKLQNAIAHNEFILHYQPKVDLLNGQLKGLEALIRWKQKDTGLTYPDHFIPLAENMGLISNITMLVVEMVFNQLELWKNTQLENTPVSINISAIDFSNKNFIDWIFNLIQAKNIKPGTIEFELTETVLFDDIDYVKEILKKLHNHGIAISVDDFGTGYSSFSYLRDLDIDYLKIDKSFIQDIEHNSQSRAIVKSIIDIGINLNVDIIAEGIETEYEKYFLRKSGCLIGQGYYFSKPLPPQDLLKNEYSTPQNI
jgi:diguanylate cyclase (GGDEF)-like protein